MFLAVPDDRAFAAFCEAVGRDDLADDESLGAQLEALFSKRDADEWESDLTARGIACVAVNEGPHAAYMLNAPWAEELGFVADAAATGLGPYRRYGRSVQTMRDVGPLGPAHENGAHTREILKELGYAEDAIDALVADGIVHEG